MRTTLFTLILLALSGSSAAAQVTPELSPGQRLWIRGVAWNNRLDRGVTGTVQAIRGDTILLARAGGRDTTAVHPQAGSQVFVWEGGGTSAGVGAGLGAVLGAMIGGATQAFVKPSCSSSDWICFDASPLINILGGGAAGLMAGWIIGDLIPTDRWVRLPAGTVGLNPILRPSPGGWTFGTRMSF